MSSPTNPSTALTTSISACHASLDDLVTLQNRYVRSVSLFQTHLRQLVTLLNRIWSQLNKSSSKKRSPVKDQLSTLREISRRMAELADGGRSPQDMKADAVLAVGQMSSNQRRVLTQIKELEQMTRSQMVDKIKEMGVGRGNSGLELDFEDAAAKAWDKVRETMVKDKGIIEVQTRRLDRDRMKVEEVFGLCGVDTVEGGYYPDIHSNVDRHVDAVTADGKLEEIRGIVFGIDMGCTQNGLIMTFTNDMSALELNS